MEFGSDSKRGKKSINYVYTHCKKKLIHFFIYYLSTVKKLNYATTQNFAKSAVNRNKYIKEKLPYKMYQNEANSSCYKCNILENNKT